jgi:hypothetical protein
MSNYWWECENSSTMTETGLRTGWKRFKSHYRSGIFSYCTGETQVFFEIFWILLILCHLQRLD